MSDAPSVSWLFVPADRPDRFEKARRAGADETILDLEDAVAPESKASARAYAVHWLSATGSAWVRINGLGTRWHEDDIDAVVGSRGLRGLIVPKAEDPGALAHIAGRGGGVGLVPLVETARGVRNLDGICATPGVGRLAFGSIDLALDIDAWEPDALQYARSELVFAARAAGLEPPIDGVTTDVRDLGVVARAAQRARALGFAGKLCIHPAQVLPVNQAFAPTSVELAWARRVVDAAGPSEDGAFLLDGRMIDRPLLMRAQRLLARASDA
ncbi:MAG TPA: CoA ester lyase [Solirubrobacteraceae bacterium]|nr:CoA ester lyase [Solirubrobacteraceae bacterium]